MPRDDEAHRRIDAMAATLSHHESTLNSHSTDLGAMHEQRGELRWQSDMLRKLDASVDELRHDKTARDSEDAAAERASSVFKTRIVFVLTSAASCYTILQFGHTIVAWLTHH